MCSYVIQRITTSCLWAGIFTAQYSMAYGDFSLTYGPELQGN